MSRCACTNGYGNELHEIFILLFGFFLFRFAEDSVRVKDMQRKLSEVIEELISSASEIEMT